MSNILQNNFPPLFSTTNIVDELDIKKIEDSKFPFQICKIPHMWIYNSKKYKRVRASPDTEETAKDCLRIWNPNETNASKRISSWLCEK